MSVDLGLVVGRGIKSLSCDSNNTVTVVFTDNTSTTFNIANKNVPNMTLKQTITNAGGGTIKVYSDGLYVFVVINGTFTKSSSGSTIAASGNTTIGTVSDSEYHPPTYAITPTTVSKNFNTKVSISSSGTVTLINDTDTTSVTMYGTIMYPCSGRLP